MSDLLDKTELEAVQRLGDVWNIVAPTFTHRPDAIEFAAIIHQAQHFIMARAAARAYPDLFRLYVEVSDDE